MARRGRRAPLHPGRAQRARGTRRPKDFGVAHQLWLLERHEKEQAAAENDEARMKEYEEKGVKHDATLYFGREPTRGESASLSRTCKRLTDNGEAVKFPRVGKKTHLRLTPLGFRKARELRKNGGCSPREINEAVRAGSRPLREKTEYRFYEHTYKQALENNAPHEQLMNIWGKLGFYQLEADRVERCCRDYLNGLPLEQRRAEVKRLKNGGLWIAPPMFTDGGTEPWPPNPDDLKERAPS